MCRYIIRVYSILCTIVYICDVPMKKNILKYYINVYFIYFNWLIVRASIVENAQDRIPIFAIDHTINFTIYLIVVLSFQISPKADFDFCF